MNKTIDHFEIEEYLKITEKGFEECEGNDKSGYITENLTIPLLSKGLIFRLKDSKIKVKLNLRQDNYIGRSDLVLEKVQLEIIPDRVNIILSESCQKSNTENLEQV